jgi:hypothetical protein
MPDGRFTVLTHPGRGGISVVDMHKQQVHMTLHTGPNPNYAGVKRVGDLGITYERIYAEDRPQLAQRLSIRHSPNLIVDDRVVFRGQPSEADLRAYLLERR